jgi:hypothetical protein
VVVYSYLDFHWPKGPAPEALRHLGGIGRRNSSAVETEFVAKIAGLVSPFHLPGDQPFEDGLDRQQKACR